jgi:signal transduction histidine kinase
LRFWNSILLLVGNLLNNATKYTRQGGAIQLSVHRVRDRVEILVKGDGIGLHRAVLPRIFDVFTQSERKLARSEGGLCVGLTVVRRLIEQHRGSVTAFSEGLEKGREFRISLQLTTEPRAQNLPIAPVAPIGTEARQMLVVDDNLDAATMRSQSPFNTSQA